MAQIATPASNNGNMAADPLQRRFRGSAKITEYEEMREKLGEGTFGVVTKARSKKTGAVVALKKIIMHNEKEGFPITALREVKLLKMLSHPNILRLEEMAVERLQADEKGKSGKKRATLYMVMPYMDHDLSGMLNNHNINFNEAQIKCYMLQLLEGVRYLHDSHILHRDMKAANILISNSGVLQIADFGLARHYDGTPPQPGGGNGQAQRDYTSLVVTRWYRPPELLLTLKRYTPAIDLWGVGCIFGEMFERKPILEGKTDIDQCVRIFQLVGSPNDQSMPGWDELPGCEGRNQWDVVKGDIKARFSRHLSPAGIDLLRQLLRLDWRQRTNAIDALQHPYFKEAPLPAKPEDLPRYQDSHELDNRKRGQEKQAAKLPPAPAGGTVGMGPDDHTGSGSGNGYGYNDRPPRSYGRDRPAPSGAYQPPPRGYDDRRGGPPPDRPPQWRQDRDRERGRGGPPPPNGHLPPRPMDLPPRPDMAPRAPAPPPPAAGRGGPNGDTYIPHYERERGQRDPYDRGRRGGSRDPDAPRPAYRDGDRPQHRERDLDRQAPRHPDRDPYRGERGGYSDQRQTRSRSPDRQRGQREDDSRRERLQNREREFYRR